MPRNEIDFSTYTRDQLADLAQQQGPVGIQARRYLGSGALTVTQPIATSADVGTLAYAILTPEQKAEVDAKAHAQALTSQVAAAQTKLSAATASVAAAVQEAQAIVQQASTVEAVDTTSLEQAVAAAVPAETPAPG